MVPMVEPPYPKTCVSQYPQCNEIFAVPMEVFQFPTIFRVVQVSMPRAVTTTCATVLMAPIEPHVTENFSMRCLQLAQARRLLLAAEPLHTAMVLRLALWALARIVRRSRKHVAQMST